MKINHQSHKIVQHILSLADFTIIDQSFQKFLPRIVFGKVHGTSAQTCFVAIEHHQAETNSLTLYVMRTNYFLNINNRICSHDQVF